MKYVVWPAMIVVSCACLCLTNINLLPPPTVPRVVIQQAIGQAYCRAENADKQVDFVLAAAIADEVEHASNDWLRRYWR